jgi:hypothetical protein
LALKDAEILRAVRESRLPDGTRFDPRETALVEEAVSLAAASHPREDRGDRDGSPIPADGVEISHATDTAIELHTRCRAPAFLVLSDVHYPGWCAWIDGTKTRLYRADFILRGLYLPPGEHVIKFEFCPLSFAIGLFLTAASVALAGALAVWQIRRSRGDPTVFEISTSPVGGKQGLEAA